MSPWSREMSPWKSEGRTSSRHGRVSAKKGRSRDWKSRHSGSEECFSESGRCSSPADARPPTPVQSRRGWYSRRSHRWSAYAELRASVPLCEAPSVNPPNPVHPVQKERQDYRDFMDGRDCALQLCAQFLPRTKAQRRKGVAGLSHGGHGVRGVGSGT